VKKSIIKSVAKVLDVKERDVLMEISRVRTAQQGKKDEGYTESEKKIAMELLRDPDLLQIFLNLCHMEYIGRDEFLIMVKLATITRRFRRGIPVLIQGPSSSGKSELVKTVLKTMNPKDKVEYMMTSSKFLAYQNNPIDHKVIVFYELQGMEEAAPMIRTAMTEGDIKTGTVMKNEQGVMGAVELETNTEGTVFVTTMASGKVDHELRTRLFCLEITHDPALSKEIFRAKARSLSESAKLLKTDQTGGEQLNLLIIKDKQLAAQMLSENRRKKYFRIFQCADSLLESLEIKVPFAERIAETFPTDDPKFHRDLDKVFNLIRASALLHQYQRNRDESGAIIATRKDYDVVYGLRSLVSDSVSAVSDNEIKFLEVAQSLVEDYGADPKYPTTKQVMDSIGVSPSTIRRYKAETAAAGLIEIIGKGMGALLKVLGIPKPQHPLPDPDVLFEENCSQDSPFNRSPILEVNNQKDYPDSAGDFPCNFSEQLSSTSFSFGDQGDVLLTGQLSDCEQLNSVASAEPDHPDGSNAGTQSKLSTDEPAPWDDNSKIKIPLPGEPGYGDCGYWLVRDNESGEEMMLDKRHAVDRLIKCEVAFVTYTEKKSGEKYENNITF
jgi:energy-coupling factor transporter ATP-binding protein EcfA2